MVVWSRAGRGEWAKRVKDAIMLCLLIVISACPAAPAARSHSLKIKTCNDTGAGTEDTVYLTFCRGTSNCTMGETNEYNLFSQLKTPGTWNAFNIPLGYEPTTMVARIDRHDDWCIEKAIWNNSTSLLGKGARIYLDGDKGDNGCSYGVHDRTDRFHPCRDQWRFFNLQGRHDFTYEIAVKPCDKKVASTAVASLCSESMCSEDVGDVVKFNLTLNRPRGGDWIQKRVKVSFNPVALKLAGTGEHWCANDIAFNDFRLVDSSSQPVDLTDENERFFYNLQMSSIQPLLNNKSSSKGTDSDMEDHMWTVVSEVVAAVLTGLLVYIGVIFRRRILPKAFNIEEVGVSESLFTPRQQRTAALRVEGGNGTIHQTLNTDYSNPGLRQRNRGGQRERSLSDPK